MRFSVLGDSISTYQDHIPPQNALYYSHVIARENGILSVGDMWWVQVQQALGWSFLVNESFSGSTVSDIYFPGAAGRTKELGNGIADPDALLIYIGINDFAQGLPLQGFCDGYSVLLQRVKARYPGIRIFCGTLMKTSLREDPKWEFPERTDGKSLDSYNNVIRMLCRANGCILADLAATNRCYETLDGTHPTVNGQYTLASAWLECLEQVGCRNAPQRYRVVRNFHRSEGMTPFQETEIYRGTVLMAKIHQSQPIDFIVSAMDSFFGKLFHSICTDIVIFESNEELFFRHKENFRKTADPVFLNIGVRRALADSFGQVFVGDESYCYYFRKGSYFDRKRELRNVLLITDQGQQSENGLISKPLARTVWLQEESTKKKGKQVDITVKDGPYYREKKVFTEIYKTETAEVVINRTVPPALTAAVLFLTVFD